MIESKEDKALTAAIAERAKRAAALEAVQAATKVAEADFDESGSEGSERALAKARVAEQSAAEHLARAERLAEKSKTAADTARTARLRAELDVMTREYRQDAQDGKLLETEFRAFVALVDAMTAREQLGEERRGLALRMMGLRSELGESGSDLMMDLSGNLHRRNFAQMREKLFSAANASSDEFRRQYFARLAAADLDLALQVRR